MRPIRQEFNELILTAEKAKKKGGSLGAVFKLIEELTEFEKKIQEAIDSQEMSENKQKIEAFIQDIDKMYEVLLGMAKGGIQSLRRQRSMPEEEVEVEETEEVEVEPEISLEDQLIEKSKDIVPTKVITPVAPKM